MYAMFKIVNIVLVIITVDYVSKDIEYYLIQEEFA